jgi:conjugal transfer pilus assembly protein TraU
MSSLNQGSFKKTRAENDKKSNAYYHIHYYAYPLLSILNLVVDLGCLSVGSYDIAYLSEFDPSHGNENLSNFMHPETFLLSNPIAVAACTADCIAATANKRAIDNLFWCSGCQGSIYPFTGFAASHVGGVATSSLLATRQLAKLHRMGLAKRTATSSSKINGELCDSSYAYRIPKSQYRLQMTFPRPNVNGAYSCNPIGMLDSTYSSGREFPHSGEDFVYLVWRKRNCCWL